MNPFRVMSIERQISIPSKFLASTPIIKDRNATPKLMPTIVKNSCRNDFSSTTDAKKVKVVITKRTPSKENANAVKIEC